MNKLTLLFLLLVSFPVLSQHKLYDLSVKTNGASWVTGINEFSVETKLFKSVYIEGTYLDYRETIERSFFYAADYVRFGGRCYEGGIKYYFTEEYKRRLFPYLKLSYRYGERGGEEGEGKYKFNHQVYENGVKLVGGLTFKLPVILFEPYVGLGVNSLNIISSRPAKYFSSQEKAHSFLNGIRVMDRRPTGVYPRITFHIGVKVGLHASLK